MLRGGMIAFTEQLHFNRVLLYWDGSEQAKCSLAFIVYVIASLDINLGRHREALTWLCKDAYGEIGSFYGLIWPRLAKWTYLKSSYFIHFFIKMLEFH